MFQTPVCQPDKTRPLYCREQAARARHQSDLAAKQTKVALWAMNSLLYCRAAVGECTSEYVRLARNHKGWELLRRRKWPWQDHCAAESEAVTQTDKQKWQLHCKSVSVSLLRASVFCTQVTAAAYDSCLRAALWWLHWSSAAEACLLLTTFLTQPLHCLR